MSIQLSKLDNIIEKFRHTIIGEPTWINSKNVFEYPEHNIETVVLLKIIRAGHGLHSMKVLCEQGLFLDMCAIWRCVNDCVEEVFFMLEHYPSVSSNVDKFIDEFFSKTIDNVATSEHQHVQTNKIQNSTVRIISGKEQDDHLRRLITNVYKANSGYIHAGYSHIMEMYGGELPATFNLSGIPSERQKEIRREIIAVATKTVIHAVGFAAQKFDNDDIYKEVKPYI